VARQCVIAAIAVFTATGLWASAVAKEDGEASQAKAAICEFGATKADFFIDVAQSPANQRRYVGYTFAGAITGDGRIDISVSDLRRLYFIGPPLKWQWKSLRVVPTVRNLHVEQYVKDGKVIDTHLDFTFALLVEGRALLDEYKDLVLSATRTCTGPR
jgi:hypothetical protein